jgi:hypothetical protein
LVGKFIVQGHFNSQTPSDDEGKHDKEFFYNSWPKKETKLDMKTERVEIHYLH